MTVVHQNLQQCYHCQIVLLVDLQRGLATEQTIDGRVMTIAKLQRNRPGTNLITINSVVYKVLVVQAATQQ